MMRRRPGRSVTSRSPSGVKTIANGRTRPSATSVTRKSWNAVRTTSPPSAFSAGAEGPQHQGPDDRPTRRRIHAGAQDTVGVHAREDIDHHDIGFERAADSKLTGRPGKHQTRIHLDMSADRGERRVVGRLETTVGAGAELARPIPPQ